MGLHESNNLAFMLCTECLEAKRRCLKSGFEITRYQSSLLFTKALDDKLDGFIQPINR